MGNVRNNQVSITTTAVEVSPAQERQELILTNVSTGGEIISISFGGTAVAGTGIVLNPFSVYSTSDAKSAPSTSISAVCSGAGGLLAIMER